MLVYNTYFYRFFYHVFSVFVMLVFSVFISMLSGQTKYKYRHERERIYLLFLFACSLDVYTNAHLYIFLVFSPKDNDLMDSFFSGSTIEPTTATSSIGNPGENGDDSNNASIIPENDNIHKNNY
jgi:hypothetical protein